MLWRKYITGGQTLEEVHHWGQALEELHHWGAGFGGSTSLEGRLWRKYTTGGQVLEEVHHWRAGFKGSASRGGGRLQGIKVSRPFSVLSLLCVCRVRCEFSVSCSATILCLLPHFRATMASSSPGTISHNKCFLTLVTAFHHSSRNVTDTYYVSYKNRCLINSVLVEWVSDWMSKSISDRMTPIPKCLIETLRPKSCFHI